MENVTIYLHRRPDGGLRVSSEEVPGMILSGEDPAKICAAIWPALVAIKREPTPHPERE